MTEPTAIQLDLLGKTQFSLYTQVCLCFGISEGTDRDDLVAKLNAGLGRLAISFPWINGNIIKLDQNGGRSPIGAIRTSSDQQQIVVKDLQGSDNSVPTMADLRKHDFAMSQLPEDVICPEKTIPVPGSLLPVFVVQATFVQGGLLVTFTGHHQAMDMTGLTVCIRLFNRASRGEAFTEDEVAAGNMAREQVIPVFDDKWKPDDEYSNRIIENVPPTTTHATKAEESVHLEWVTFAFPSEALATLKKEAMKTVSAGSYVSTDDVLSIHIYQNMTLARMHRFEKDTKVTLARNVDSRRQLSIPEDYPGMVVTRTYMTHDVAAIGAAGSLGSLAAELRAASNQAKDYLRVLATVVARSDGKKTLQSPKLDSKVDVNSSSWAKYGELWSMDFGMGLGTPEAVQRPAFSPDFESLVYLLPKKPDGSIGVVMCLRPEDTEKLRIIRSWADYARYLG